MGKNEKKGLTEAEVQEAIKKAEGFLVSQKLVLFDKESRKFLLILNANVNLWELPGGLVDKNEDLSESLEREAAEELGREIRYDLTSFVSSLREDQDILGKKYPVVYLCSAGIFKGGSVALSREHSDFSWKTKDEILSMPDNKEILPLTKTLVERAEALIALSDSLNNWKRSVAEFENYKKSKINVERDMAGRAIAEFSYRLLPVLDNFYASTEHIPEKDRESGWVQGMLHIRRQLEQVLSETGISEMETREGDVFNPSFHEAVASLNQEQEKKEKTKEQQTEKIQKVVMKGYMMGERIVRPARVMVE